MPTIAAAFAGNGIGIGENFNLHKNTSDPAGSEQDA